MTKNWKPADLRGTRHLLAERQALEEARIADNHATAAGWTQLKASYTRPYRLALDEFETRDDRWSPGPAAKDYSVASEGGGQVTARGSDYDIEEPEIFAPSGEHKLKDIRGNWGKGDTLGFDAETNLAGEMEAALKAWAGMTTPPPKSVDPTVETLVEAYLANGGQVHTVDAYRTTPEKKIKINRASIHAHAWAGGTGIPREMRQTKRRCGVRPQTGSKLWSNTV